MGRTGRLLEHRPPAPAQAATSTPIPLSAADLQRFRTEISKNGKQIVLEPDKVYSTSEGTLYYTDALGRVEKTQFTLKGPADVNPLGAGRTAGNETTAYGNPLSGVSGDVGG